MFAKDEGSIKVKNINGFLVVKPSPGKDLGLFARKDIPAGTLILSEKPLFVVFQRLGNLSVKDIDTPLSQLPPAGQTAFNSLYAAPHPHPSKTVRIWLSNAMRFGEYGAIFTYTSRFNHSCVPNVAYDRNEKNQALELRSVHNVAAGEELTICYNYCAGYYMFEERKVHLDDQYLFTCTCPACIEPGRELADMRCQLIMGLMAALRNSKLMTMATVCLEILPRSNPGRRPPPRPSVDLEPAYWFLMMKLLEVQGVADADLAYLCTVAAKTVRDSVIEEGMVTLDKAQYMLAMNKKALTLYSLFRGLHNDSIAEVEGELVDLDFLMKKRKGGIKKRPVSLTMREGGL